MSNLKRGVCIVGVVFILLSFACKVNEEVSPEGKAFDQAVAELKQVSLAINGSTPNQGDEDLSILDDLGNVRVVGLGEATHGTKEFFEMKHRIFKYLVQKHGFKAFVFESDFAESIYIDRYVCRGEGDLDAIMRTRMHFWTWRTKEVKALLQWMYETNQGRSEADKIHFVGMDCQYLDMQPGLLREYLKKVSPSFLAETEALIKEVENIEWTTETFQKWSPQYLDDLMARLQSTRDKMSSRRSDWSARTTPWEYEEALQLVTSIRQTCDFYYHYVRDSTDAKIRDRYMAENALWALGVLGEGGKLAVWAHNMHVAKDPYMYKATEGWSTGYHLWEKLGGDYRVIGFSFCQGTFRVISYENNQYIGPLVQSIEEEPIADSINALFHREDKKQFVLRLDRIPAGGDLYGWLNEGRQLLMIGGLYNGHPGPYYTVCKILNLYDVLIHFDRTTAAEDI